MLNYNKNKYLKYKIKEVTNKSDIFLLYKTRKENEIDKDNIFSSRHSLFSFFNIFKNGKMWKIENEFGEIIGYSRISFDNKELNNDFKNLNNKKNVFLKGTFIIPKYRGYGLQNKLHKVSLKYIKKKKYKNIIALVHPDNIASRKNLKKIGLINYGFRMGSNNTIRILMLKNK